jgi:hypothetical protein
LDHEKEGRPVKGRFVLTLVVVAGVAAAGFAADRLGPRSPGMPETPGSAGSGAWFCPHGGGKGWRVTLEVANPGTEEVRVRTSSYGTEGETGPAKVTAIPPGSKKDLTVPASDRAASSVVEFFGGWAAAGWVAETETGVAAEPCMSELSDTLLMPDGTAERGENAFVVVANPFDVDAVFNVTVFEQDRDPVTLADWTGFVLRPRQAAVFHLNETSLGEPTAAARVQVSLGRVAAASFGTAMGGSVRSAAAVLGPPPERVFLAGGPDTGESDLLVSNTTDERERFEVTVLASQDGRALTEQARKLEPKSANEFPFVTEGPSGMRLAGLDGFGVAAVRRSFGVQADRGATAGLPEAAADWVVLPAGLEGPLEPRLVITNPGDETAEVSVTLLGEERPVQTEPAELSIRAGRTAVVPEDFMSRGTRSAAVVRASSGEVVPAFATYSSNRSGYAVSAGVPIPR